MAQDVKNDIKKAIQVNTIPLIAIMTAVTTVLTMFVKIPTPTRGYLNLSDTMIFFSSYAFGPWVGGIIGGLLAWPVAVFLMGKAAGDIAFYAYIVPFLVSTVGGSIIAGVVLIALEKNSTLKKMQASLAR